MTLPTTAALDTAAASGSGSAPTIDEALMIDWLKSVRGHVLAMQTALINNASIVSTTSAALAAIGNAINTTGKTLNKTVYNSTDGKFYSASGTTAGSAWNAVAPDTGTITPA